MVAVALGNEEIGRGERRNLPDASSEQRTLCCHWFNGIASVITKHWENTGYVNI